MLCHIFHALALITRSGNEGKPDRLRSNAKMRLPRSIQNEMSELPVVT
jgi:hypothetical protein